MSDSLKDCDGSSLASEGGFALRDVPLCLNESLLQKLAVHVAEHTMDCGTGARRVTPRNRRQKKTASSAALNVTPVNPCVIKSCRAQRLTATTSVVNAATL